MTMWFALACCAVGACSSLVAWRIAVRLGRDSLVWPVLGLFAGPLVLPVLLMMTPQAGHGSRVVRPWLLLSVGMTLIVAGAGGASALFLKALEPMPERVVATANVDGVAVSTEPDGPTAFAISMLVGGAALVAGIAVGGLGGLVLTPPVAFVIEKAIERKRNGSTPPGSGPSQLTKMGGRLMQAIADLLGGILLLLAAWAYAFGMLRSAAMALLVVLLLLLGHLGGPLAVRARTALVLALLGLALLFWRTPGQELQTSLQRFHEKKDEAGPTAFSTLEKLGIFGLNIAMAFGGFVIGFPEVAKETLYLCLRGPSMRIWDSDFAMRSPKVRAEVQRSLEFVERHGGEQGPISLPATRISWSRYSMRTDSARVALALNSPMELRGTAHREGAIWRLDFVGRARAEYPRRAVHPLFAVDGKLVQLDEGLFWVLQQSGWLHPYTAEWRWSVLSDDPRLKDLHAPLLSLRERLLCWLLSGP